MKIQKLSVKFALVGMALLGMLVSAPVSAEERERPDNWYAVNPNLISDIEDRIDDHSGGEGDAKALKAWSELLNGLYGKASVKVALRRAKANARKNYDDAGDLWKRAVAALEIVQDLQLFEYDYNFDPELIEVIQNMVNENNRKGKSGQERTWRNLLVALTGEGDLKKATKKIKSLKKRDRPPEWASIIDALEGYEPKFHGYATAKGAYSYDLYNEETGEKLYSLDVDAGTSKGTSGNYRSGKVQWDIQVVGDGESDYLSYGYWARSRANRDENKTYKRERVAFYHGDNPTTDISQVRGAALYRGESVGTWQYNTTKEREINSFTGDVELIANFEKGNVAGHVKNLEGSNLPFDRVSLGTAEFDSEAQFEGTTRAFQGGSPVGDHGEWNGGFFNQDNPEDAPSELGGSYRVSTGEGVSDVDIQGSFGTSLVGHGEFVD